ncbi:MAG: nicotinate-nucleotide diphosphorylase (carboxylating) [Chloroflexi bacterium]|nr:nicotinate-nucleotide diphosphorylase (carboxylating) [Chloroflexota bacterium]|tara:strand:+ start:22036 stop:22884 length:849 start_codon:yes stop_codon:yes gene_type:complete
MNFLPDIKTLIHEALREDLGSGDITTNILVDSQTQAVGELVAKQDGILCGIGISKEVFLTVDPSLDINISKNDGDTIKSGDLLSEIKGCASSILIAERVALNFLQHLSGIATNTSHYVYAINNLPAKIIDTRKTIPGLRELAKYAVQTGGGSNHRHGLSDGILIKDNHIESFKKQGMSISKAISLVKSKAPHTLKLEIEVKNIEEAIEAIEAGAEMILLDNMSPEDMKEVASINQGKALLEASGGITLETVSMVAKSGVDLISVGALTHSSKALDISLNFKI